jgi:SAM-dependent methyltransferase
MAQAYDLMTVGVMPYRQVGAVLAERLRKELKKVGQGQPQAQSKAQVLEVACGTGSLSVELAGQGFEVYGLDYSPQMLQLARQKATDTGQKIEYYCQDMREALPIYNLDGIICFYGGLNFLNSGERLQQAFEVIYAALKPGGVLIFDQFQPDKARQLFSGTSAGDYEQFFAVTQSECDETGQVHHQITYFLRQADGSYQREDEEHFIRLHPFGEITARLELAGFEPVRLESLYPELDDLFFEDSTLFVATKPQTNQP